MFSEVKDIQISGGCYNNGVALEGILSQRMNIVYGRNGSGKSSLAKAIFDYTHDTAEKKFPLSFLPSLGDEAKAHMFVYSEDFVLNNVKLQKEGLEQIVMIGKQVEISNKEDELKANKEDASRQLDEHKTKLAEYQELESRAERELTNAVKGEYARRERDFRGLNNKPRVNQETINAIYQRKAASVAHSIATLTREIEEGTNKILGVTDAQKVTWYAPSCDMPDILQTVSALLEKKVQQVELGERDHYLMTILTNPRLSHYVDDAKHDLIDAQATVCPLCQQPLTQGTLHELEAQIQRVLNEDVEEYKSELTNAIAKISDINCMGPAFPVDIYDADIRDFNDAVSRVNHALKEVRSRLDAKTKNLFNSEQALDLDAIGQLYASLTQSCKKLQNDVDAFNQSIDDRKTLENELKEKNQILAYLENQTLFDGYYTAIKVVGQTQQVISNIEKQLQDIRRQLKDLESQRSQTKIAIDFINQCISSVFFEKDRLVLEQADGKFVLKSRGKSVAPDSVSTGERNIIGLAYFFASLYKNTSEATRFSQSYLVVIDDPITSFDQDNRLGVMTFLKKQLTDLLVGNNDSKVLVMSHDQRTIDLLVSINSSVENYANRGSGKKGHDDYYVYELHRRTRRKAYTKTKNEYSQMLNLLYRFAQEEDPEKIEYVGIGNTIRRVLETFSLMTCNTADYARVIDNPYLRLYPPQEYDWKQTKEEFRRVLTRIVLNPESHSATQIDQDSYESTFTRENLQKLAQYTLAFIWCVNDQHLWSSLEQGWKGKVDEWFRQLFKIS